MAIINPYLAFNGNAEEAFEFYKSVFGGEFTALQRYKDTPDDDKMSASDQEKILHISLPIGQGSVLMASDALGTIGQNLTVGNNFSLAILPESEEELTEKSSAASACRVSKHLKTRKSPKRAWTF